MKNAGLQTYISRNKKNDPLTQGLGWFSIALGAAELILPGGLARVVGVKKHRWLFRFLGLRELASGVGILTRKNSAPWMWSRVAGDAVDLALLGSAFVLPGTKHGRVAAATAAVAGVTVLDVMASQERTRRNGEGLEGAFERDLRVRKSVIIDRPANELYQFWRNFENLPQVMYHLESVRVENGNDRRSQWVAKGPAGIPVKWDSELTEDVPNERIAWRSLPGSMVENRGVVRFERAPGGRGTMVTVDLEYNPPAGGLGAIIATLFRKNPKQEIEDSLRYFKQLMETGVVVTTKGQSAGRKTSVSKKFDYKVPEPREVEGSPKPEFAHS